MGVLEYIFRRGRTEVIQHSVACTPEIIAQQDSEVREIGE